MIASTVGRLMLTVGLGGQPKPPMYKRIPIVMITRSRPFLSMSGVAGSQVRERLAGRRSGLVAPGLYKKEGYDEIVSVVSSDIHRVTFIPLGCGTTATPEDTQPAAEQLAAEVFKMVYKPYTAAVQQKA